MTPNAEYEGTHTIAMVAFGDPNDPTGHVALPPKPMCVEHGPACPASKALADRVLSKCRDSDGDGDCYLCRTGYWLCPSPNGSSGTP